MNLDVGFINKINEVEGGAHIYLIFNQLIYIFKIFYPRKHDWSSVHGTPPRVIWAHLHEIKVFRIEIKTWPTFPLLLLTSPEGLITLQWKADRNKKQDQRKSLITRPQRYFPSHGAGPDLRNACYIGSCWWVEQAFLVWE